MRRAHELADFVLASADKYSFELSRLTAVGYSNGANIAAAMMLLRAEVLPSAVLLRAMLPLSNPPVPDLAGKRALLSAGESDPIIPLSNVQELATLLQNAGADVHRDSAVGAWTDRRGSGGRAPLDVS